MRRVVVRVRWSWNGPVEPIFFQPNMNTQDILKKVEEIAGPVLENLGFELVERELIMESGRWILRLYIDKEGGVTIDDCSRASRSVEDVIEIEEIVPGHYNLEMSSPGINRPLRFRRHFEKFRGSAIKLKTLHPIDGRSNYKGILDGMDGDDILMTVDGMKFRVPFAELAKARLNEDEARSKKQEARSRG